MSSQQSSFQPIAPKPAANIIPAGEDMQRGNVSSNNYTTTNNSVSRHDPPRHALINHHRDHREIGSGTPLETLAELSTTTTTTTKTRTKTTTTTKRTGALFSFSGKTYEVGNVIPKCPSDDCNFAKRYQCLIKKRDTAQEDKTLIQCSVCKRGLTHMSCYINFVNDNKNGKLQKDANSDALTLTCGKACYNRVAKREKMRQDKIKRLVDKRRCIPWDRDAVSDGGPTSMSVLLKWLTTKPNYARFNRGTRNNVTGETKYAISLEVVNAITEAGIITPRSQEAVIAKISQLETDYDEAHDWLTGVGSTVTDKATIKAALLMRCRYYFDLHEVMHDRALSNGTIINVDGNSNTSSDHLDQTSPPKMINNQEKDCQDSHAQEMLYQDRHNQDRHYQERRNQEQHSEERYHEEMHNHGSHNHEGCNQKTHSHEIHSQEIHGQEMHNQDKHNQNRHNQNRHNQERHDTTSFQYSINVGTDSNISKENSEKRKFSSDARCTFVPKRSVGDSDEPQKKVSMNNIESSKSIYKKKTEGNVWLKEDAAIHEGMSKKTANCKLEEKKLKRELETKKLNNAMHTLKKQKLQMDLTMELARNRHELREKGVPESEINILLPIDFLKQKPKFMDIDIGSEAGSSSSNSTTGAN